MVNGDVKCLIRDARSRRWRYRLAVGPNSYRGCILDASRTRAIPGLAAVILKAAKTRGRDKHRGLQRGSSMPGTGKESVDRCQAIPGVARSIILRTLSLSLFLRRPDANRRACGRRYVDVIFRWSLVSTTCALGSLKLYSVRQDDFSTALAFLILICPAFRGRDRKAAAHRSLISNKLLPLLTLGT